MEAEGALVSLLNLFLEADKTLLHLKDLEGAPKGAGEVSTLTRSTGREIDLLLDSSAAEAVIGRATGMTITVGLWSSTGVMLHDQGFNIPPQQ